MKSLIIIIYLLLQYSPENLEYQLKSSVVEIKLSKFETAKG